MGSSQMSEGAPELTELQQACLQKIFDHFNRTGYWPHYRDILKRLVREVGSIDLQAVLTSIPINPRWSGYLSPDQELVLTVDRLLRCRGSEEVLGDFARTVGYAAGRYMESDEATIVITNEDLQRHLGLEGVDYA